MEIGNREKIGIAVVAILVLVGLCGGLYLLLVVDGLAANVRDVLVIVLAFEFIVIASAMLFMMWQLFQLILLLRHEVVPLIHTTKDTVEQVKHTTTFIGQSVAAPVVSASGFFAGTKAMLDTLRGKKEPHEILPIVQQEMTQKEPQHD